MMERFICIHCVYKTVSAVIPVRVPREIAQKIKELVDAGLYPNRSDLIREALRRLVASEGMTAQRSVLGKVVATIASTMIVWNEKTVTDVILFWSAARGEATVESDVDLLVLVENAEGWVVRQRLYDLIYPLIPVLRIDVSSVVIDKKRFALMVVERAFCPSYSGGGFTIAWRLFR
jgi:Arc/MetJ-type ribon-helix-helix transcriptional regulator